MVDAKERQALNYRIGREIALTQLRPGRRFGGGFVRNA
jgi:hypothetical protein